MVTSWKEDAPCKGLTKVFFGSHNERAISHRARVAAAKSICSNCPYRMICLREALARREFTGVWGGVDFDENEHRAIRQTKN